MNHTFHRTELPAFYLIYDPSVSPPGLDSRSLNPSISWKGRSSSGRWRVERGAVSPLLIFSSHRFHSAVASYSLATLSTRLTPILGGGLSGSSSVTWTTSGLLDATVLSRVATRSARSWVSRTNHGGDGSKNPEVQVLQMVFSQTEPGQ